MKLLNDKESDNEIKSIAVNEINSLKEESY